MGGALSMDPLHIRATRLMAHGAKMKGGRSDTASCCLRQELALGVSERPPDCRKGLAIEEFRLTLNQG